MIVVRRSLVQLVDIAHSDPVMRSVDATDALALAHNAPIFFLKHWRRAGRVEAGGAAEGQLHFRLRYSGGMNITTNAIKATAKSSTIAK